MSSFGNRAKTSASNLLSSFGDRALPYIYPNTHAADQAVTWQTSNPSGAAIMRRLAAIPQAVWVAGVQTSDVQTKVSQFLNVTAASQKLPTLVAYQIYGRDNGGYSAGGATSPADYRTWVQNFAAGVGNRPVIIIIEPDALLQLTIGLTQAQQQERIDMLQYAVNIFGTLSRAHVYIDAGNSSGMPAATMISRLQRLNLTSIRGFSLNISNFLYTADELAYGNTIASQIGGKRFVIDTSRNGNGPAPDYQFANPPGRAFGTEPTLKPKLSPYLDALLWIKIPGESDGDRDGAPPSGVWWPEYVLDLAAHTPGW